MTARSKDGAQSAETDGRGVGGYACAIFGLIFRHHDEWERNVCYALGFAIVQLVGNGVKEEEIVEGAADLAYAVTAIA